MALCIAKMVWNLCTEEQCFRQVGSSRPHVILIFRLVALIDVLRFYTFVSTFWRGVIVIVFLILDQFATTTPCAPRERFVEHESNHLGLCLYCHT